MEILHRTFTDIHSESCWPRVSLCITNNIHVRHSLWLKKVAAVHSANQRSPRVALKWRCRRLCSTCLSPSWALHLAWKIKFRKCRGLYELFFSSKKSVHIPQRPNVVWRGNAAVNYVAVTEALGASPSIVAAGLAADNLICAIYFTTLFALASSIPPDPPSSPGLGTEFCPWVLPIQVQ